MWGLIQKEGKGIYIFELNEDNGEIQSVDTGYDIEASTYLAQTEQFCMQLLKRMKHVVWLHLKRREWTAYTH